MRRTPGTVLGRSVGHRSRLPVSVTGPPVSPTPCYALVSRRVKCDFCHAAEEAIAYETTVYSATARNWPDFRDHAQSQHGDQFMVAWCHGASGIGLSAVGGLPIFDTPTVRHDISTALETTLAAPDRELDHICCGNLGRVDFLLEAGKRLARPDLLDEARRRAGQIVRRAERMGTYRLHAHVQGMTDSPSLFQGTAGIGYELLRLAEPDRVPCVLLWE